MIFFIRFSEDLMDNNSKRIYMGNFINSSQDLGANWMWKLAYQICNEPKKKKDVVTRIHFLC